MFVGRNPDGSIYGTWTCKQVDDEFHPRMEELDDTHPDVVAFLSRPLPVLNDPRDAKIADLESRLAAVEVKQDSVSVRVQPLTP